MCSPARAYTRLQCVARVMCLPPPSNCLSPCPILFPCVCVCVCVCAQLQVQHHRQFSHWKSHQRCMDVFYLQHAEVARLYCLHDLVTVVTQYDFRQEVRVSLESCAMSAIASTVLALARERECVCMRASLCVICALPLYIPQHTAPQVVQDVIETRFRTNRGEKTATPSTVDPVVRCAHAHLRFSCCRTSFSILFIISCLCPVIIPTCPAHSMPLSTIRRLKVLRLALPQISTPPLIN